MSDDTPRQPDPGPSEPASGDASSPEPTKKRRARSKTTKLLLAVLFGVGVKKRAKSKKPSGTAKSENPEAPEAPEKPAKPEKPGRTPEQIERARRVRGRVRAALAIVLVVGAVGGGGGWYLWSRWVSVPDLVGMSRTQAGTVLEDLGLHVGVISEAYVGDEGQFATGTVVAHVPGYQARVAPGTPVGVSVVVGPAWTKMPELRGLTVTQSVALLTSLEMTAPVVDPVLHIVPVESYLHGMGFKVTTSSVPPGTRIERGTMVMLSVDRAVGDTERRFIFGHPVTIAARGAESCYENCHEERQCSRCHLRVLGGIDLPDSVTPGDLIRDVALGAAGLRTDAGGPRFVRVEKKGASAYSVVLNADTPSQDKSRRGRMLEATMGTFKGTLGHAGITELTVTWVDAKTGRAQMTARMTNENIWRNKWSGLSAEQLPQLADYFKE